MSADNWSECPNCVRILRQKQAAARTIVEKDYGKIPAEKYLENFRRLEESFPSEPTGTTLREDYSFWLDGHTLDIDYVAQCSDCQFRYTFKRKENILKGVKP